MTTTPLTSAGADAESATTGWRPTLKVVVAAYVVGTLAFTAVGLTYLHAGVLEGLRDADLDVNQWFVDHRSPGWDDFSLFWSHFADTLTIIGVAAVACLVLWRRHEWRWIAVIVFGLVLEAGVFISVNHLVRRERPPVLTLGEAPSTFSFPSGHIAATVVLYGALAVILATATRSTVARALIFLVPVGFALSVGFARVYRGMHFLSDVIAGALLGALALITVLVATRANYPRPLEDER